MRLRRKLYGVNQNYFELFDLPAQFEIDLAVLDANYRKIQFEVHPDRFATSPPGDKLRSMQLATLANEAYQTLRNPASRARHLLNMHGIETLEDSNTSMSAAFLMQQMEWREAVEEARLSGDIGHLEALLNEMQSETENLVQTLHTHLDIHPNLQKAVEAVRELAFIDKVKADIKQIIEKLEH